MQVFTVKDLIAALGAEASSMLSVAGHDRSSDVLSRMWSLVEVKSMLEDMVDAGTLKAKDKVTVSKEGSLVFA